MLYKRNPTNSKVRPDPKAKKKLLYWHNPTYPKIWPGPRLFILFVTKKKGKKDVIKAYD